MSYYNVNVDASGTTNVETLTGNTGGAVSPSGGNINTVGTGSITIAGNPGTSTLTTQLTGLTNHNVLIGAGTATITNVAPSATSGVPLISQGAASDPAFGTAVVAGGGTGDTSFVAYTPICGGTTTTGALQSVASTGTSGQVLMSNGASALPTFQTFSLTTITITAVSSSPYVVLTTDYYLSVNTSSARTIQLPNAPATGRIFVIKDTSGTANTNNITVTTVGGAVNIDGATSYVITQAYGSIQLAFNGTSYEVY